MSAGSVFIGERKEEDSGSVDRISNLPDEILRSILSRLTLTDAVKSSSLSRRWVGLWTSALTALDFDALKAPRRPAFTQWVSGVMRQLSSSTSKLTKFRVSSTYLSNDWLKTGDNIEEWLKFAFSKRVESLELSMGDSYYLGPEDRFINHIKTPAGLSGIKSLRSLRLSHVEVRGEKIEHFISNCPCLEELSLFKSRSLVRLRIVSSSSSSSPPLALKRLEVMKCWYLKSLEIDDAPCLTHFAYDHPVRRAAATELRLKNCVSLVDVNIGCDGCSDSATACSPLAAAISCYAAQLAALTLKIAPMVIRFPHPVEFTRLELLTVLMHPSFDHVIFDLVTLINVCPRLHTLRLELSNLHDWVDEFEHPPGPDLVVVDRESIRTVEIVEFTGYKSNRRFMEYVLKHFVKLERIVLRITWKLRREEARNCALGFKSKASPAIDFVIV